MTWPFTRLAEGRWLENGAEIQSAPIQTGDRSIPFEVAAEAYKEYKAQFSGDQSLAMLNERGGFGSSEIAILLFLRIKRLEERHALLEFR